MMKYLQKTWFRIFISLVAGGFAAEFLHISTGDPNRKMGNGSSFMLLAFAAMSYIILTNFSKKATR